MPRSKEHHLNRAKHMLRHNFDLAGVVTDSDSLAEIDEVVEEIANAFEAMLVEVEVKRMKRVLMSRFIDYSISLDSYSGSECEVLPYTFAEIFDQDCMTLSQRERDDLQIAIKGLCESFKEEGVSTIYINQHLNRVAEVIVAALDII